MLICGVVFFVAFFCATFTEIRVERPLHRVLCDLLSQNVEWYIEQYDRYSDPGFPGGNSTEACGKRNDSPV